MLDLTPREYAVLLRRDFCAFAQRCFHEINPGATFVPGDFIELLASKLTAVHAGRIKRLIINIPPRYLKSLLGSVALPAWWLGHTPTAQIICASYAQDLADKLSRDCRMVMLAPWYQSLFATRLSRQRQAAGEFITTVHGSRLATSVGGVLTGRGADLLIVDDPLKPDEALSGAQRSAVNEWFSNTLLSRLNDKRHGAIILIMQRLHEDDLTGYLLRQGGWDVLRLPAIAETDEEHRIETELGLFHTFHRRAGDALHPEREPIEVLRDMRRTMGEYNFAGQYQQSPAPLDGGMVKRDWLRSYAPQDLPAAFDLVFQSWDTANKPTELSDYSVCTTWGAKGGNLYLLHVLRKQLDYPNLKRAVREQAALHNAAAVVIEDKASGTQLIQDLIGEGMHAVKAYKPAGDKIMRLHAQTAMIENGFVHLPQEALWLDSYIHELLIFPKGHYDDQVDSTAQALDWFRQHTTEPGMLTYYRRMLEQLD
ncbi:MAG: Phage terminase, large subunit [uncultured Chloroflexia bacterium]|uniref:Phage terminase, large subunit n=1 Tax=uncultured Chloroflexia bacterium TaxID=1672391 RepID=A0A6J4IDY6_9CHLR|nr:MAG: Phage terminase, large subunit [uncultured Chloroflexia bacterium]